MKGAHPYIIAQEIHTKNIYLPKTKTQIFQGGRKQRQERKALQQASIECLKSMLQNREAFYKSCK
ncbi:hypothetical protein IC582_021449 [Cucumis melo]